MKRASVTEAKNQLSALLDRVRHGETVLIEDRGIPIAQLNPINRAGAATTDQDRLARLERQAILRPLPARRSPIKLLQPLPRGRARVSLSSLVHEERRDGR